MIYTENQILRKMVFEYSNCSLYLKNYIRFLVKLNKTRIIPRLQERMLKMAIFFSFGVFWTVLNQNFLTHPPHVSFPVKDLIRNVEFLLL